MGRLTHKLHVVLHDQHRMVLRQTLQELAGALALVFRHAGYRLVQEKEGRLLDNHHANFKPLHLPVGQRTCLMMRFIEEAQGLQRGGNFVHLGRTHGAK
jgi:hypothetical protein